jgi:hypothetical protein
MFPKNVKHISTKRYLKGAISYGKYENFNLADYTYDKVDLVNHNRKLLVRYFNLPSEPKWLKQTHSNICFDVTSNNYIGDAAFTTDKNVVCAILTADCLPIFACTKKGTKVGVAHAGWQGILAGIIESFISNFDANNTLIHFGPAISKNFLELGEDIYSQFIDKNKIFDKAFTKANDKYYLDIFKIARIILNSFGFYLISGGDECTFSQSKDYFSYRRDGDKSGRMAHIIWIE